jgi:hypothetical protein
LENSILKITVINNLLIFIQLPSIFFEVRLWSVPFEADPSKPLKGQPLELGFGEIPFEANPSKSSKGQPL